MKINQLLFESDTTPIYRGLAVEGEKQVGDIVTVSVRADRKPTNSTILSTVMFDYAIEKRFNIRNARRSAVFATTERDYARDYASNLTPGALIELDLQSATKVLYNPNIDDSMYAMDLGPSRSSVIQLFTDEATKYINRHNDDRSVDMVVNFFTSKAIPVDRYLTVDSPEDLIDQLARDVNRHDPEGGEAKQLADAIKAIAMTMIQGYAVVNAAQFHVSGDVEVIICGVSQVRGKVVEFFG